MKKQLFIVFCSLFSIFIFSQDTVGARIVFEQETINYGRIVQGKDNGIRTFVFSNTGNAPLVIIDVKSSCGCAIPTKPTKPIMPGKSDKIEVKYNMKIGPISKTITVESNAVNKSNIPLRIKGMVLSNKR